MAGFLYLVMYSVRSLLMSLFIHVWMPLLCISFALSFFMYVLCSFVSLFVRYSVM